MIRSMVNGDFQSTSSYDDELEKFNSTKSKVIKKIILVFIGDCLGLYRLFMINPETMTLLMQMVQERCLTICS